MHVLVSGWFSFEQMGATAGDLIARDIVCSWLAENDITYDIAVASPFLVPGGVEWEKTSPLNYTDVVFVCGPFGNGWPVTDFLSHFSGARLTGVNLSLLQSLEEWILSRSYVNATVHELPIRTLLFTLLLPQYQLSG